MQKWLDRMHAKNRNKILKWTFLGDVLVAVNPNKFLGIYGQKYHEKYNIDFSIPSALREIVTDTASSPPVPHIYWTAQQCYLRLVSTWSNQCVLVSGESGTGKTESTKRFIGHVSFMCQNKDSGHLHEQITKVNPLLEAFGNAVTPLNTNSSRFGKLIELYIDADARLWGAKIQDYLLEKSRVVSQGPGERNFHIFYYLFAGLSKDQKVYYNLGAATDYRILQHGRDPAFSRKSFLEMGRTFNDLLTVMKAVGFTEDNVDTVLTVLASILHLTNVTFCDSQDDQDSVYITDVHALTAAANLLGVDEANLRDGLFSNRLNVKGEHLKQMKKHYQAEDGRDALAKVLYTRLFGWIVCHINQHLCQDQHKWDHTRTLSILDFAGFERFQLNRLDQLCINVANERLHRFFCQHVFDMEQRDLQLQGVNAESVHFKDNQELVDLFFKKPVGIFYLLDEESKFPQSTDRSLVAKLNNACSRNAHFRSVRGNSHEFVIVHYAGQVVYNAHGMLERNRDHLGPHLENVMMESSKANIKMLFDTSEHATGSFSRSFGAQRSRPKLSQVSGNTNLKQTISVPCLRTSSTQDREKSFVSRYFRKSLTELVSKLEDSHPWFVRCVRPNEKSLPGVFNDDLVTAQLRYNGLLEIAKIRRDGFPVRLTFDDFLKRYKDITPFDKASTETDCDRVEKILVEAGLRQWANGHSMVFLKLDTVRQLDEIVLNIRKKCEEEKRRKLKEELAKATKESVLRSTKSRETSALSSVKDASQARRGDDLSATQSGHEKVKGWIEDLNTGGDSKDSQPLSPTNASLLTLNIPDTAIEVDKVSTPEETHLLDRGSWDRFQIVPRDNHPEHSSLQPGMKLIKAACYALSLLFVLGLAVAAKLAFLTLTSGTLRNTKSSSDDPRPTMLLLVICFPYLCNMLAYTGRSLFGSTGWPSFRMIFVMLGVELSHTAGLSLLVFRVLPEVDMLRALILLMSVYTGPSFMMAFSSAYNLVRGSRGYLYKVFIGCFCFIVQVGCLAAFCVQPSVLTPTDERDLQKMADDVTEDDTHVRPRPFSTVFLWELPVSLVLVSLSFWENFIDGDFQLFSVKVPVNAWKKSLHQVRERLYIWLSLWKIGWTVLMALVLVDGFTFSLSFPTPSEREDQDGDAGSTNHLARFGPLYICLLASGLCNYFASLACKLNMQNFSFSTGLTFVTPVSAGVILLRCRLDFMPLSDSAYSWVCSESWSEELPYHLGLLGLVWVAQTILLHHIWMSDSERLAKIDKLFIQPKHCSVLTEQTLMMRRRTPTNEKTLQKGLDESSHARTNEDGDIIPQVYACATMWHETRGEMVKLLKSMFRMDIDHSARSIAQKYYKIKDPDYYEYETHVFFDDAFDYVDNGEAVPNSFVLRFIECLDEAISSVHERPTTMHAPERTPTAYGGRLTWTLPGGTSLIVHLKDRLKIRNRKRWSQVMYLYYLLGFNILANDESVPEHIPEETAQAAFGKKVKLTAAQLRKRRRSAFYSRTAIFNYVTEDVQRKSENTYILTLDGDVDFKPEAVRLLVDRMKKNRKVGAACGRIHPIGTGPIVWYQQFEYAIGHWLQKATEHVFGCVLCAPGCFSLFRGSALMDDNVARMYATKSSEAGHYVQFDQGEDRWLSTLLLQQGYRIDYCAAADAYTQAPETFSEFFNQRRRWGPSTLANILDLLGDWRNVVHMNDNVSSLYIFYQTMMFVSTLLGPATVLLMMAGAYQVVFGITVFQSYLLSILPAVGFLLLCMLAQPSTQLSVAATMSAIFAIVMTIVMVGTVGTAIEGSITSPNVLFMVMILVIFVISAFLHPRELGDLVPGAIYFICIPAGYLILTIYFITNLHIVSWGTRETPVVGKKEGDSGSSNSASLGGQLNSSAEEEENKGGNSRRGIFGWLGLRRVVEELGEAVKQIRELVYKSDKKKKKKVYTTEGTAVADEESSAESTNKLLRELIVELRVARNTDMGGEMNSSDGHVTRKALRPSDGFRLPGLTISSTEDKDDTEEDTKQNSNLHQVVVSNPSLPPKVAPKPTSPTVTVSTTVAAEQTPVCSNNERSWGSWINNSALGEGPIKVLGDRERVFWAQVMAKYLKPIPQDPQETERIRRDLLALRNNVVFAFFMTSAVWIALFMQLEILQNELKDHMFVHIPKIHKDGYLSFQPLGLIFLSCFSIILLMQFLGMFLHRWGTFLHTLSITSLGIGNHQKEQEKVKEIIIRVSELQKLRDIEMEPEPDYDEPLPDYLDDGEGDAGLDSISSRFSAGDVPPPDYEDDIETRQGPPVARKPRRTDYHSSRQHHNEDKSSEPPSYHTDAAHVSNRRRRRDIFDSRGNPRAFALENAFERRLRNNVQRKPRGNYYDAQHLERPRENNFEVKFVERSKTSQLSLETELPQPVDYAEQRRRLDRRSSRYDGYHGGDQTENVQVYTHGQQQHRYMNGLRGGLERNVFTQGHGPSHLYGQAVKHGVQGFGRI